MAGLWNTCHAMPGAASRIKPFHAHDDTVVLHALMLCFWTLLLSILRTRHVSVFAFWPLIFPSKLRGGFHHSFPSFQMETSLGRLAYLTATLAYIGFRWDSSKEERENGHTDPSHHQHSLLGYFLPGFWQLMPVMHVEEQCPYCFVAQPAYRRTLIPSSHDENFLGLPLMG